MGFNKTMRPEGASTVTAPEKAWVDSPPLTAGQINAKFRASLAGWRKHMLANAEIYANLRQEAGLPSKPRYLISDVGLISHNGYDSQRFTWTYIPPQAGSLKVWPAGKIRPWSVIFIHSLGQSYDKARMVGYKNRSGQWVKGNTALLYVSKDKYGHDNNRWMAGLRQLTQVRQAGANPVSIHFCVSRRGDVVVSADLNDEAYHGGGVIRPLGANNAVSIGFELEEELIRIEPHGRVYVSPYTKPQLVALAIVLKKIETFRPIKHVYLTKRVPNGDDDLGQTERLVQQHLSGYIQHNDVNTPKQRTDAGAQFNLLPGRGGKFGSSRWLELGYREDDGHAWKDFRTGITHYNMKAGLDEVWGYMAKIRKFDLATQVFTDKIPALETTLLKDLALALQSANKGQQAMLRSHMKKVWALRRSIQMEARSRTTMYSQAQARGSQQWNIIASVSAVISRAINSFDTSNLSVPTGPLQSFNEDTGTWYEGGKDTGVG